MDNEKLLSLLVKYQKAFINEKKTLNASNNTLSVYNYILDEFYEFIVEDGTIYDVLEIDKSYVLSFVTNNEKASTNTKSLKLSIMKSFLSFIEEEEKLDGKLTYSLKKLTIKKESIEVEALDDEEVIKLLEYLRTKKVSFNSVRDRLLIKLILFTGVRASECLGINLSDLSLVEDDTVYKVRVFGKGSKERFVYIAADKINRELEYLNEFLVDYIAITNKNKAMSRIGLYKMISNKMRAAGIYKKRCSHT
ncbi:MAG: tyrosine-type recombinase/integrase [Sulfurimonas sp.]|nr:tyrosine-type recombinase/integrase [Sulfurimonas sp.]